MSPRPGPRRRPGPGPGPGRSRRRSPAELDALLDGGSSGDPRLDRLLTAARGPARPVETAASAPALGTEPDTRPDAAAPSRSRRVLTRLGTATLLTKGITAAVGAVVVGAAAVAGVTHHLPGQHRPVPAPVHSSPSGSSGSDDPVSDGPSRRRTLSATPTSSARLSTPSPTATATPTPSASAASDLPALCQVWLRLPAGADAVRSQPRFVVLIQAAGGRQAVTGFCRNLASQSPSATASTSGATSTGRTAPTPSRTTSASRTGTTPTPSTSTSTQR